MNTGMTIATIFSLLLALATAGDATRHQARVSDSTAIRGQNLNHNETMVRDTTLNQRTEDWSLWLSGEQAFAPVSLLVQFSFYRPGLVCPPIMCNHNETLVRDAAR
jgi:hypothetical protein